MCGIAGIIQENQHRFMPEHVKKMTSSLNHRGPECGGLWISNDGMAILGHRRLSIFDLSENGAQPMKLGGRYSITFNGAIYNYIELRRDLEKRGYSFKSNSDTEVILACYDLYGEECVEHFDGMFAFGIYDEVEKEFFAARDRFGEKPFYYYFDGNHFIFASEIKSFWSAGVEREANLRMFFNFLTIGYTDNPAQPEETFYQRIFRLPPASRLFYDPVTRELETEKYWELDPNFQNKNISPQDAVNQFGEIFESSVRLRLRSDVPLGVSLSGGLDSSSILHTIHSLQSRIAPASFTAVFPGFELDETGFAGRVASVYESKNQSVEITVDDLVNDWAKFIDHQEEPFGSASAFAQFKVYECARDNGITVLLDGQGADETLAGYSKYYKWYWQELFQKRKLRSSGEVKAARNLGIQEDFGFRNVVAALFPDIASVLLERQYLVNALRHEDLTRDFVKLQSREAYYTTPENFNLNGILHFNTCVHGLEELLRYADRNSMAHGREVRLPFLDHKLVEYVFSLPSSFKIHKGWTKYILRKYMDGKLPDEITWRKRKVGFEPPQEEWMKDKRLGDMITEARRKLVNAKILKPSVLDRPIHAHSAHSADSDEWRYLAAAEFL